jgi:hypothetical protein
VQLLKKEITLKKRDNDTGIAAVPVSVLEKYFKTLSRPELKEENLEDAAYESLLYDARRREMELLNAERASRLKKEGFPVDRWWELKDPSFIE